MADPVVVPAASPVPQIQRSIVRKVAEIMGEISRVPKSGRNAFHNYDYATEADIAEAVRMGMAKRALALLPNVQKSEFSQLGKMRLCTLTVAFTLEDGDSGETRVIHIVGEGTDQGDKASYKAMTGAEKYALMKLFLIPTGDDPERDDPRPPPTPTGPRAEAVKAAAQARTAPPLSAQMSKPTPPPLTRPRLVDVKEGETEEQAKARVNGNGAYRRIKEALDKAELRGKPAADFLQKVTGKTTRAALDDNDVGLVQSALAAEREPPPPSDSDAPPEEAPF